MVATMRSLVILLVLAWAMLPTEAKSAQEDSEYACTAVLNDLIHMGPIVMRNNRKAYMMFLVIQAGGSSCGAYNAILNMVKQEEAAKQAAKQAGDQ